MGIASAMSRIVRCRSAVAASTVIAWSAIEAASENLTMPLMGRNSG